MLGVTGFPTPDIAHWTYPLPLRIAGAKNIYTLHDLVPLRLPYTTLDNKTAYFKKIRSVLEHADHIVTVSEASRADIVDLFGYPESKVTNTYQSVDIPQKLRDKPDEVVQREVEGAFALNTRGISCSSARSSPRRTSAA